ncbi:hypothetical protein Hrd1104_06795 [Halorhabdus sp. CBA1104]|uniref:hypothetical protein n=1 Tax=Halorhabdus sp. CBA1104 TaxID=1380432 RepID=UPI0012B22900|nr:hypothetical protein [Halorhabdus sp. CBA1104]QGN07031.1 hypothetical protein Hrd1104_06795 [Halorhabdus sp. CBA1104]
MAEIDISGDDDDPDVNVSASGSRLPSFLGTRLVILAIVVGVLYLVRPLIHGIVYATLYTPSGLVLFGGTAVTALVLWFLPPWRLERDEKRRSMVSVLFEDDESPAGDVLASSGSAMRKLRIFGGIVTVLFVLSVLVGIPAGALEQRTLAQQTMADATELDEFPQANANNPRVVPREVSDVTTRGSVSYRTHRLGASDIARQEDGSLAWSYPIEPDGARNKLLENQRGVLVANMTSMDEQQITVYEADFTHGEGMWLHRSARWNVKLGGYLSKYNDEAVEFSHDGQPYLYYPKTGHEWHLLPLPHTTPKWNGGALVHPDGTIEHLTPEQAQENEILDGQRLYPMTLTRSEMGSLGYREGIINQLPVVGAHEGQIEVAALPEGANNEQPFVIDLEGERMSYVTAMEPYGEDTRGLDEVWLADAETGEYTFFGTDEETLTGPERAMGIARNEDSQTGWGDNFVVTEPVPVTVDGDLWWHIKVAPTDYTDVTRNVFVNADANNAIELSDDTAIREFIRGDIDEDELTAGENGTDVQPAPDGEDVLYYVLITNDNGEVVDRIPVKAGQDTQIVAPGDERATDNETAN